MKNYEKQWVYKLLLYQYFKFTLVENQFKQQIRWSSKNAFDEISIWRNFRTANLCYGEISVRRNVRTAKFPTAKFPYGDVSLRRYFLTAKLPTAKFHTAEFPTVKFPSAEQSMWLSEGLHPELLRKSLFSQLLGHSSLPAVIPPRLERFIIACQTICLCADPHISRNSLLSDSNYTCFSVPNAVALPKERSTLSLKIGVVKKKSSRLSGCIHTFRL